MTDQLKLYWNLYREHFSNEDILRDFTNLMDVYHPQKNGKIIDIGCGQSKYLIDFFKKSKHQLYAIDNEPVQIEALKSRIQEVKSDGKITYSNNKYPTSEFSDLTFSGVIVSDLLHFMNLNEAKVFLQAIEKQISKESVILIKAHSWKHKLNGDFSYFKHYFKIQDFHNLLPKKKYEYLYINEKSEEYSVEMIVLIKKWIRLICNGENIIDESEIIFHQEEYLKDSLKEESITIVVKRI